MASLSVYLCQQEEKKKVSSRPISGLTAILTATPMNVSEQPRTNFENRTAIYRTPRTLVN
jgi:hypothetical protein